MRAREFLRHYRVAFAALAISAAVHAAVFVGMPNRGDPLEDEAAGPAYSATLQAVSDEPAAAPAPKPARPAAPHRAARPRPKAQPVEVPGPIAQVTAGPLAPERDVPAIDAPPA